MDIIFIILAITCIITNIFRTIYEILKAKQKIDSSNKIIFVIMAIIMIALWVSWFNMCTYDPIKMNIPMWISYLGFGLFIFGLLIFLTALIQLRGVENTKSLVTNGIFAVIRHPMYIAFILWLIGYALYEKALISLCLSIIFIINIVIWIKIEEKETKLKFDNYEEYKRKTWF